MSRVVIAGGGIAGLAVAHALRARDPELAIEVLEKSPRVGGNVRSERASGYLCEWGPDGFLDNAPDTLALVRAVGLESALQPSNPAAQRRFIFREGMLHEVPTAPGAFFKSQLLSWPGKLRIAWEPLAQRRPEIDESILEFAARRIGREAATVLIDSMVSGIFAGDARALSLRACFPKMWEMETEHGGLFRALLAKRRQRKATGAIGAPAGRLTSFEGGMETLIDGVARSLGDRVVRTSTPVQAVHQDLQFSVVAGDRHIEADAVVLAGPASESAAIVRRMDPVLGELLDGIDSAPLAVLCLGYDAAALAADRGPLNGFGLLVPRSEGIRMLGVLWETSIYPDRAPEGKALLRVMIGGARDRDAVTLEDSELLSIVRRELQLTMQVSLAPEFVKVIRHRRGIPQYTRGHLARLQSIDSRLQAHPGLYLAGNSYRGVAINSCIAEAGPLADRVIAQLRARPEFRYATR